MTSRTGKPSVLLEETFSALRVTCMGKRELAMRSPGWLFLVVTSGDGEQAPQTENHGQCNLSHRLHVEMKYSHACSLIGVCVDEIRGATDWSCHGRTISQYKPKMVARDRFSLIARTGGTQPPV